MKFSDPVHFEIKSFSSLSNSEIHRILKLRSEVFVVEQICVYLDPDDGDINALHVQAFNVQNELIGYCRIYFSECWHIGRIITSQSARGNQVGSNLVLKAVEYCINQQSETSIEMSAQVYLTDFYRKLGFVTEGKMYLEDGIPHLKMRYQD